ncbi:MULTISPECIES: PRTRC system protein C [unclassified Thioalkalivibrio]|uniref:PRTRC system protein C n=1 Tax=unclassified Thioalkalivibrio TaxID=2621013 RepID=UPI00037713C5|nr:MULTISPECIES: PRTRC system protein C [unclassified Thioalkalivibrio]
MTATTETMTRIFRLGATDFPDPDPQMQPDDVVELLQRNNPAMPPCQLGERSVEGNRLVFTLDKEPAKTKG